MHIIVLWNFAVAQPIFDLLSRNVTFFVAHRSQAVDIFLAILIVCFLLPSIVVGLEWLTGLLGGRVRKCFHAVVVTVLVGLIFLPPLKRIGGLPGAVAITVASLIGFAVMASYLRFRGVRMLVSLLSVVLVVFPAVFVFGSPVRGLVFPHEEPARVATQMKAEAPIVVVVFDELSITALLDERGQIDSIRYPNFETLSRNGYWFRNATTPGAYTSRALQSLLTGKYAPHLVRPGSREYNQTLFTALEGTYDFEVFEWATRLCPDRLCEAVPLREGLDQRMASLLRDLSAIYVAIVVPEDLMDGLPDVTQTLRDFITSQPGPDAVAGDKTRRTLVRENDPPVVFKKFLESLHDRQHPTFFFASSVESVGKLWFW